jgi:hypothetical protein
LKDTTKPVIVAPAGTPRLAKFTINLPEDVEGSATVAYAAPVVKEFDGLPQATPEPTLTAEEGTPTALVTEPVTTEAYAVELEMLLGEFHEAPVIRLPTLGPTNCPVEDTAFAVRPLTVSIGPFTTTAMNVLRVTAST